MEDQTTHNNNEHMKQLHPPHLLTDHLHQDDDDTASYDESEPPSFRYLSRPRPYPRPTPCHYCTNNDINEIATATATASSGITFSPESTPPQSPESSWSFCSPTGTPSPLLPLPAVSHRCLLTLRHHDGNIHSIAVTRGLVFTGSSSPYIRAWLLPDCVEHGYVKARLGEVRSMLAHASMLFTSHKDHKIRIWNISDSSPPHPPPPSPTPCSCDDIDDEDNPIRPRKITTLPKQSPFTRLFLPKTRSQIPHRDIVSCSAYNRADGILYTGSYDKTVKAWVVSERKCVDSFAAHADNINDMVINQDGYLFTCSSDGTLKMWSKVCGETFHTLTMTLHFQTHPIHALALSEAASPSEGSASFLYSGSSDGCIHVWEQQISGEYKGRGCIQAHQFGILCMRVVMENMVISGSVDSMIKIWKRSHEWKEGVMVNVRHECVAVLEGHKGPVKCIAACLEEDVSFVRGFMVFSAGLDRTFKVWKVKVLPESTTAVRGNTSSEGGGDNYGGYVNEEMETPSSPVLSPLWVKRVQRHGT